MISLRWPASAQRSRSSAEVGAERTHAFGGVVGVLDDAKLLAVRVKLIDQMGHDFDLAPVEIEFARLPGRWLDDVGFAFLLQVSLLFLPFGNDLGCRGSFAGVVHFLFRDPGRIAVEVGVGEHAGGRAGVVEDVEPELAVVVAHARAAPDDLLELAHRADDARQNDVLAGRRIDAGREQLRVVRMTGVLVSTSWNSTRWPRPMSPSSAVTRHT